jgi:hypothetical protein
MSIPLNKPSLIALPDNWFSLHFICYEYSGPSNIFGYSNYDNSGSSAKGVFKCLGYSSLDKEVFKFEFIADRAVSGRTNWNGQPVLSSELYIPVGSSKVSFGWPGSVHTINPSKSSFCIKKKDAAAKYFTGTEKIEDVKTFAETLSNESKTLIKCALINTLVGERSKNWGVINHSKTTSKINLSPSHEKHLKSFDLKSWQEFSQTATTLNMLDKSSVYRTLEPHIISGAAFTPQLPKLLGEALLENINVETLYRTESISQLIKNLNAVNRMFSTELCYFFFNASFLGKTMANVDPSIKDTEALTEFFNLNKLDISNDTLTFKTQYATKENMTAEEMEKEGKAETTSNIATQLLTSFVASYSNRISNLSSYSCMKKVANWLIEDLKADPTKAFELHVAHFAPMPDPFTATEVDEQSAISLAQALFYLALGATIPECVLDYALRQAGSDTTYHQLLGAYSLIESMAGKSELEPV